MNVIAIVDDHLGLAAALAEELSRQEIATTAVIDPRGAQPTAQLLRLAPDLCLVDLDLGWQQSAGLGIVRTATAAGLRAAMLTGATEAAALGRCIEAGAIGVIAKGLAFAEVVHGITNMLAGRSCNSDSEMLQWVLAAQRSQAKEDRALQPFRHLSTREQIVLQHLIEGHRVEEIADCDFVSVATVRSQVQSVLRKLGVQTQLAAVAAARRAEWVPSGDARITIATQARAS